jgi:FkbM family methyltransferase
LNLTFTDISEDVRRRRLTRWYEYEPEVLNVIRRVVKPGDCVIDAGACIGTHACVMGALAGENGLVLAFEPNMESYKVLVYTVHVVNKLNNVDCLRVGLWSSDEWRELWSLDKVGYSSFHHYATDATHSERVECRRLDSLLGTTNHPRLIKIDCEGTEIEVLKGAHNILARGVDCVIVELNYYLMKILKSSDALIRGYMGELGYDMFLINIGDAKTGELHAPIKVNRGQRIEIHNGSHVNVMFSTEEKVKEYWQ